MAACPTPSIRPPTPRFLDASPSPWHAVQTVGRAARRRRLRRRRRAARVARRCRPPATSTRGGALVAWRRPAGAGAAPRPPRRRPHRLPGPARQAATPTAGAPAGASSASRSTAACCSTAGSTATSASPAGSSLADGSDALVDVDRADRPRAAAGHPPRPRRQRARPGARPPGAPDARCGRTAARRRRSSEWIAERAGTSRPGVRGSCACSTCSRPPCSAPTARCWPAAASTTRCRAGPRRPRCSAREPARPRRGDRPVRPRGGRLGSRRPARRAVPRDRARAAPRRRRRRRATTSTGRSPRRAACRPTTPTPSTRTTPSATIPTTRPIVNHGPAIKLNANQRYATSADTAALFQRACDRRRRAAPGVRVAQQHAVRLDDRPAHGDPARHRHRRRRRPAAVDALGPRAVRRRRPAVAGRRR